MNDRIEPRRIAVLVGSLRAASINARLAQALARMAPPTLNLQTVPIGDLPLYNQDLDADLPAPVQRLKRAVADADGLIVVTPEYNRSIPGVLKNALDWGSRPYGQSAFARKPAAVIGASIGAIGTACAQQHLRTVLAYLDMPTMGQPEAFIQVGEGLFKDDGSIGNEKVDKLLRAWLAAYVRWIDAARPVG